MTPSPHSSHGRMIQIGLSLEPEGVAGLHGLCAITFDASDLAPVAADPDLVSSLARLSHASDELDRARALAEIRSWLLRSAREACRPGGAFEGFAPFRLNAPFVQNGALDLPDELHDEGLYAIAEASPSARRPSDPFGAPEAAQALARMEAGLIDFARALGVAAFGLVTRADGLSAKQNPSITDRVIGDQPLDFDALSHQRWRLARERLALEACALPGSPARQGPRL